ncbi:MAG: hypothetical protein V1738_02345 [Patescibacteria group bacterium]
MNKFQFSTKTLVIVFGVWAAVSTVMAAYLFLTTGQDEQTKIELGPVSAPVLEADPQGGIVTDIPSAVALPDSGTTAQTIESTDLPEPPPVSIWPKSAQGLSRIEFNPSIGDIFHLHHDRLSGALFMAVVEPNGIKAIWRLGRDLSIKPVLRGNRMPGEIFLEADSNGVLYAGFSHPGDLYRSDDLGESWVRVADDIDGAFWSMADDGRGTLWGALHAYNKAWLYRSTDDGRSWIVWKDFQQIYSEHAVTYQDGDDRFALRHLHDVAHHEGKLFVGVGDVARFTVMSEDNGETWREVWSEGFTANVTLADRSGILLGPDRLQTHGIALYEFATGRTVEVWSPIPYGYSGYAYSMMEMNGVYYAAFHTETNEVEEFSGKSGIIVSPNGKDWYPFLELGAVTNWARTDIFMAPGKFLEGYITLNGALYKFEPPIGRWFDVHKMFE